MRVLLLVAGMFMGASAWAQNAWTAAGALSLGRVSHTFTALADGRGLVAGGKSSAFSGNVASTEVYDPGSNAWTPAASMSTARADHSATLLADGRVLVVGGCAGGAPCNPPSATAEIFNPAGNTWTAAGRLAEARALHTANRLPDGRVIVFGGQGTCNSTVCNTLASTEIFDPASNAWSAGPNLPQARLQATSTTLLDGRVLVAGGCTSSGLPCPVLSSIVYSPMTNNFGNVAAMVVPRTAHMAVALDSGDVLVAGGADGGSFTQRTAEIYRVASNTWSAVPDSLATHFAAAIERLPSGDVLIAGGSGAVDPTPFVEVYAPGNSAWTQVGSLAAGRESPRLARLTGGQVVLTGGLDTQLNGVAAAERFQQGPTPLVLLTPASIDFGYQALRTTSETRTLRVSNSGTAPLSVSSATLAGSNAGDFSFLSSCSGPVAPGGHCDIELRFRPQVVKDRSAVLSIADNAPNSPHQAALCGFGYIGAPNFWAPAGTMTESRFGHTLTALPDGRALAIGGGTAPSSVELFSASVWSAVAPMQVGRTRHTSTVLLDGRIVAAGGASTPSAEVYNRIANAWTATAAMLVRRSGHAAARLPSGKVAVFGGCSTGPCNSTEVFDPVMNNWSAGPAMSVPRAEATATALLDGRVLVSGGSATLKQAEIFDPVSGSFSDAGMLRRARSGHTANRLPDGRVIVAGGCEGSYCAQTEIFDPATLRWLRGPAMSLPRVLHSSLTLQDGRVVVAGGIYFCESEFGLCFSTRGVDVFNPATARWAVFPGLLEARASFASTLLSTGQLLVSGGDDNFSEPRATAEILTPLP